MKITNKKAFLNYEVLERLETGISLLGSEVKSVRDGRCNFSDAYVKIISRELWLVNADISKYKYDGSTTYNPTRSRKLLIKKDEYIYLANQIKQGNLTLIPLSIYTKGPIVKVEIAIAKGKKRYEKKLAEKKKDLERELHLEKRKYMV
jgi:SsrA-binding protein